MRLSRVFLLLAGVLFVVPACAAPTTPQPRQPSSLVVVEGDRQTGTAGDELSLQLVARVVDDQGDGVGGTTLLWVGDGSAWADVTDTADDGLTRNYWTLAPHVGTQVLEVWTYDIQTRQRGVLLKTFTATSTSP